MASVAIPSAVSNPKLTSVKMTSLSIVFGRVMTFSPILASRSAFFWVLAAAQADEHVQMMLAVILGDDVCDVDKLAADRHAMGLSRLVPRMVPPWVRMPDSVSSLSSMVRFSMSPRKPSRNPMSCIP